MGIAEHRILTHNEFIKWRINNPFVEPPEKMFGSTKCRKLLNAVMHNVICANQKTVSFVFCGLHAHAMFNRTCFPAFVGALDVISSVLSIRLFPFIVDNIAIRYISIWYRIFTSIIMQAPQKTLLQDAHFSIISSSWFKTWQKSQTTHTESSRRFTAPLLLYRKPTNLMFKVIMHL